MASGMPARLIRPVVIVGLVAAAAGAAIIGNPSGGAGTARRRAPDTVAAAPRRAPAGIAAAQRRPLPVARVPPAMARRPGSAGVAAAYGYPSRCLIVTIPAADPTYARADFDRRAPCGRYDGDVTAIFHRAGRAWRPVLVTTEYRCPVAPLPVTVQTALDVCPSYLAGRASGR